jgi:GT2 family glycosyltransferase
MNASIVVATYNRDEDLVRVIKSVLGQSYNSFELIIVDQTQEHSKETLGYLSQIKDPRYRYFLVSPPSIPAAENFGLSKARGDIIIFVDDDVVLDQNFIKNHVEAYSSKEVGGVAGRIKVPGQSKSGKLYHITRTGWNVGGFDYDKDGIAKSGGRGCNMSFRRNVLVKLGGFDTGYTQNAHRFESDMAYRVIAAGYQIVYKASASLTHYHTPTGGSRANSGLFRDEASFANEFRFFYKNLNHSKLVLILYYLMQILYVVPHPNPKIAISRIVYLVQGSRNARINLNNNKLTFKSVVVARGRYPAKTLMD